MPMTITLGARTATSVTINTAGRNAGLYDQIEVQYSARKDFRFVPAPIVSMATAAALAIQNLNQDNLYFIRAREWNAVNGYQPWTAPLAAYTPVAAARDTAPLSIMVRPAIIVPPEPVVWSVTGGAVAGYPAANLDSDAPGEQFWMNASAGQLDFDTAGSPIDTIALLATNAPAAMTWQIAAYPTVADRNANTAIAYNSGHIPFHASLNLPGRPSYHALHRLPAPRNEQFWRIFFSGSAGFPPANRLTISHGVVGLARTAKNIAADKTEAPLDYGSLERLRDGTPDRRYGVRGRRVEFEIALMTEAQWETQFADLRMKIGLTDPVLVVPNMRAGVFLHDRILYGPVQAMRVNQPHTPRFSHSFTIESLI